MELRGCYAVLKKVTIISVSVNILLIAATIVIYTITNLPENRKTPNITMANYQPNISKLRMGRIPKNGTICSECDVKNVAVNDTLYDRFEYLDDGRKLCCIENHHDIQNLILEVNKLEINS